MSRGSGRPQNTVFVGECGSEGDRAGVVVCLLSRHSTMDYPTRTLRERKEEMRVGPGRIIEGERWGGCVGKVAVWPLRREERSTEMRRERWREKRDQEMDGRQERQMSKPKVHMNGWVRLRPPSRVMTGNLVRRYHHPVVHWSSQLWMIRHFEFAVQEPRAPAASSSEDASACALVL